MIRKWVSKLNKKLTERVVSLRKNYEVPIKVWFEPDRNTGRLRIPTDSLFMTGETRDMSKTGIAFIVPSIRIHENYLVGESRILNAELDLPAGKIRMQITGRRYEQIGQHISSARFLIGAEITRISADDREVYEAFLKFGNKGKKTSLELVER